MRACSPPDHWCLEGTLVLPPSIQPIGLHTPTAAVLTQLMQCVANGTCRPPTIWIGCPWHCRVPLASWLQAWRARYLLGLPPMGSKNAPSDACGSIGSAHATAPLPPDALNGVNVPCAVEIVRLPDLKLEWPADRHAEVVRVYIQDQPPSTPVFVPGTMLDFLT